MGSMMKADSDRRELIQAVTAQLLNPDCPFPCRRSGMSVRSSRSTSTAARHERDRETKALPVVRSCAALLHINRSSMRPNGMIVVLRAGGGVRQLDAELINRHVEHAYAVIGHGVRVLLAARRIVRSDEVCVTRATDVSIAELDDVGCCPFGGKRLLANEQP
jgi:hypothetical protein